MGSRGAIAQSTVGSTFTEFELANNPPESKLSTGKKTRKIEKFQNLWLIIFLVQGTKPTDQIKSWKEIKTLDSTITVPTNPLKKINLAKMHSMGRVVAEPNEKSDDPWELDTSQRTIVLN